MGALQSPTLEVLAARCRSTLARSLAVLLLLAAASVAAADVVVLTDGDRFTGKKEGERRGLIQFKTPYGTLSIPRGRIERIVYEGGREEIINAPPAPPSPPPQPLRIALSISGTSFWYAWDAKDEVADTTLRLAVTLDGEPIATFVDARVDPDDIKGATVNAFAFIAEEVSQAGAGGVRVSPPETSPGRTELKLELPPELAGDHQLRLAYEVHDGADGAWRDAASTTLEIQLRADVPTVVRVRQDRGKMEFSGFRKKRMKFVETFRLEARSE